MSVSRDRSFQRVALVWTLRLWMKWSFEKNRGGVGRREENADWELVVQLLCRQRKITKACLFSLPRLTCRRFMARFTTAAHGLLTWTDRFLLAPLVSYNLRFCHPFPAQFSELNFVCPTYYELGLSLSVYKAGVEKYNRSGMEAGVGLGALKRKNIGQI